MMITALVKKTVLGTAGMLLVGGLIFGRDVFSYISTAGNSVKEAVKDTVPLEFEIKRAKDMLTGIEPEISKSKRMVVEQAVEIEELERKIGQRADNAADHRAAVMSRNEQLKSGQTTFLISDKSYSAEQLTEDLKRRFETLKQIQATLDQEQKVLVFKRTSMEANRKKLENMVVARKDLALQLETLQARLDTVRAAEDMKQISVDDSEFNRVRDLVGQLDKHIKVRERVADAESLPSEGLIPVTDKAGTKTVVDEVDAFLNTKAKTANVAQKD